MSEEKTFKEEIQPIIDRLGHREEIAKKLAGKNLVKECQVFRLPLPNEVWKFDDPSTHNTKRGPGYPYTFIGEEKGMATVIDSRSGESVLFPLNELVNNKDFLAASRQ